LVGTKDFKFWMDIHDGCLSTKAKEFEVSGDAAIALLPLSPHAGTSGGQLLISGLTNAVAAAVAI